MSKDAKIRELQHRLTRMRAEIVLTAVGWFCGLYVVWVILRGLGL